jgi:vitamin B12 transporter
MQNRRKISHVCLIELVFILALASSQLACALETLPEMTVTAPRQSLNERISNNQELDEEDITVAHERSIVDVIQGFSGVSSNKTGGFGQPGSLFMRGSGGQGLVTLDGIPLILAVPGFLNLDPLPAEAIKSIELEKGPGAAYQSFQALGGAIRLQTQDRETTGGGFPWKVAVLGSCVKRRRVE